MKGENAQRKSWSLVLLIENSTARAPNLVLLTVDQQDAQKDQLDLVNQQTLCYQSRQRDVSAHQSGLQTTNVHKRGKKIFSINNQQHDSFNPGLRFQNESFNSQIICQQLNSVFPKLGTVQVFSISRLNQVKTQSPSKIMFP